jgi:hypothetical protein
MKVNVEMLEKIATLLLTKLRESKGSEIDLKNDFYWAISSEDLYNPYVEPKSITLGQLSDDIEELSRLEGSDDTAIAYDLKRLSTILEALSNENPLAF